MKHLTFADLDKALEFKLNPGITLTTRATGRSAVSHREKGSACVKIDGVKYQMEAVIDAMLNRTGVTENTRVPYAEHMANLQLAYSQGV